MRFLSPLLMTLILTGLTLQAQQKTTLTMEDAIAIAMKSNVQVVASQNAYNTASANVLPKTIGRQLPTLDATANASKTVLNKVSGVPSGSSSFNSYSYGLNANYLIFDGTRRFDEIAQVRIEETSAQYDLERVRQDVTLQVDQAYFNVLKNQQLLRIGDENLKRSEEQLKRLEERNKLGAQILSDVYKQRVQVGSDKLAVSRAKNNLNTSKATLSSLIGIDVNADLELKDVSAENLTVNLQDMPFDQAMEKAYANRRDYLASVKRVESARRGISIARSGFFPTVSAFAGYNWADQNLNFDKYSNKDKMNFGVSVSVPIFSGFETQARVIQTDQSYQTSKSNLENTRRRVALDVKISMLNMQTAFDNMKLSAENVKAAKEDLRLATERYNLGAGTILDQIVGNASYASAEANYIQSTYDFLYAREQYNLAVGTLNVK